MSIPMQPRHETIRPSRMTAGLMAGTPVMTLEGDLPVEFLTPGDRVITRDSGVAVLRDIRVTRLRGAAVSVAVDTLGHDRPDTALTLPAGQKVLVRDWRAKALYGAEQALVPVARLADGDFIRHLGEIEMVLFDLVFDKEHVIYAGGLELAAAAQVKEAA